MSSSTPTAATRFAFLALTGMVVPGIVNFPSLIQVSQVQVNILLLSSLLVLVIGVITAEILRRKHLNVYQQIGRQ